MSTPESQDYWERIAPLFNELPEDTLLVDLYIRNKAQRLVGVNDSEIAQKVRAILRPNEYGRYNRVISALERSHKLELKTVGDVRRLSDRDISIHRGIGETHLPIARRLFPREEK